MRLTSTTWCTWFIFILKIVMFRGVGAGNLIVSCVLVKSYQSINTRISAYWQEQATEFRHAHMRLSVACHCRDSLIRRTIYLISYGQGFVVLCFVSVIALFLLIHLIHLPTFFRVDSLMMTSSNGNIYRVTGHLCGEFTGHRWIPRTKASDAELWCFDLRLNERLSKQWWFATPSRPLWRHSNVPLGHLYDSSKWHCIPEREWAQSAYVE